MKFEKILAPRRTPLAVALALVSAGAIGHANADSAPSSGVAETPRHALHMSQRTERLMRPARERTSQNALRHPSSVTVSVLRH